MLRINKKRINEFLEFRKWSRADLASAMKYHRSYLTLVLDGERPPSRAFMERFIKVSGLPVEEVFFFS